jgi:hypothetical protein
MARISALIGIGFMLVGALAYALPQQQEAYRLVPAFVGIIISLFGMISLAQTHAEADLMFANFVNCALLVVYSVMLIAPDFANFSRNTVELTADISLICFAGIFLYVARRAFVEAKAS